MIYLAVVVIVYSVIIMYQAIESCGVPWMKYGNLATVNTSEIKGVQLNTCSSATAIY